MELVERKNNEIEIIPSEGLEILGEPIIKGNILIVIEMDKKGMHYESHYDLNCMKKLTLKERKNNFPKMKIIKFKKHNLYLQIKHEIKDKNIEYIAYYLKNSINNRTVYRESQAASYGLQELKPKEILDKYLDRKDPNRFFRLKYSKYSLEEKVDYWEDDITFYDRMFNADKKESDFDYKNILIYFLEKKFFKDIQKHDKEPIPSDIIKKLAKRFEIKPNIALRLCELEYESNEWKEIVRKAGHNKKYKSK